ncbi:MAG: TonB-dependent receptor family protein [Cyclobacteriaceae bacterium]|nr:TonB-dependent receptor family protein [Cyclobacteriaceae bacterium]
MKLIITFLAFMAPFSVLFAQSSLSGKLMDMTTDQPIEYASMALYMEKDSSLVNGTVSNNDGTFTISNLKAGAYYLTAQFLGYDLQTIQGIHLNKNESIALPVIKLSPNQQFLEEVEVTADRASTIHKIDRQVFAADQFQTAAGGTATDLMRNMPSVTVDAMGEISVRGSSGFVMLINGKPVQTDPAIVLNQIPANSIENIEIITTPSAKYDPDGKAGIINIITKQGTTDGLYAMVNAKIGMPSIEDYDNAEKAPRHGADFTLNYRKEKWDLSAGASYLRNDISGRRVGNVYTIISGIKTQFPSDGERSFDEVSYSGKLNIGYTPSSSSRLNLGFYAGKRSKDRTADIVYYNNHSVLESTGEILHSMQYYNENLRIRRSDFALGSIDYEHIFNNESKISTSLLFEYTMLGGPTTNLNLGWPETNIIYQDERNSNDNPLHGTRYMLNYQLKPLPIGQLDMGYQYRNLDHTGDFYYERKNNTTGQFELVPDFSSKVNLSRSIHSAYGQLTGDKGKVNYGLGIRVEAMDRQLDMTDKAGLVDTSYIYDFIKPYPSANIMYSPRDDFHIKASYSKRVERTTTFKMNPFPEREHSETLEQGDPELLPEFIDLVEVGVVKDFGENSLYATGYYRHVKNLINRVNTVYNDSILNRIYSNVGTGTAAGVEYGSEFKIVNGWKLFYGANIYKYIISGTFDAQPINTNAWVYSINANTTVDFSKTANMTFALNYISNRNTAQGEDSRYLSPNLSIRKSFLNNSLTATVQWLNMDMGLLDTNEQEISTWRQGEFYTTTNYIYEVDMIMVNLSYVINKAKNKAKFIKSEFGEKEF